MINFTKGYELDLPDETATAAFASALAKCLHPEIVIYLHGELGTGKTTLVRALLENLGHVGLSKSPTYTLVETYKFDAFIVYHFDLYRLADPTELEFIGIRDYTSEDAVCIFEWADKGIGTIPDSDIEITLDFVGESRKALIKATSDRGLQILQNMALVI